MLKLTQSYLFWTHFQSIFFFVKNITTTTTTTNLTMIKKLLFLILFQLTIRNVLSDCIMYGECGPNEKETSVYNCKYNGKAKPLPQHILKKFKETCPHLYTGNETHTCCDVDQIIRMIDGISVPRQFMFRCPACYLNFRTLVCDMSCNPNQHEFVHVNSEKPFNRYLYELQKKKLEEENESQDYESENIEEDKSDKNEIETNLDINADNQTVLEITSFTAFITPYFAEKIYNSCK